MGNSHSLIELIEHEMCDCFRRPPKIKNCLKCKCIVKDKNDFFCRDCKILYDDDDEYMYIIPMFG